MRRLRFTTITLLLVLTAFFNIERFDWGQANLLDIQSFVYLLTITAVLSILLFPALSREGRVLILSFPLWLGLYFLGKFLAANRPLLGGIFTYLTITEIVFLTVSVGLAHRLTQHLQEFEESVRDIVLVHAGQQVATVEAASKQIHAEITRSRHYQRPMSVLLVEPDPASIEMLLNQTAREVEQALRTHYAQAKMAQVIQEHLRVIDYVLVGDAENHFVVVCPEAGGADSQVLTERIEAALAHKLNVAVRCSSAAFPEEGLTFGGLLHCAGDKLKASIEAERSEPGIEKQKDPSLSILSHAEKTADFADLR